MQRKPSAPARVLSANRVVHETPWVCWPLLGGCGCVIGLNFAGGPCPGCGAYAAIRVVARHPKPTEGATA